jgi:RHS repeat-associated protein
MKFTGHERDFASAGGAGDDLDYMHQRFNSPITGRFLSADVARGKPGQPQSWNRYVYTLGNPIKNIDPNGKSSVAAVVIVAGVVVALSAVATIHATRMQTDTKYRQRVVDGARLTGETATAMVSSVLSKRTEKDGAADMVPGSKPSDHGGRGRFKSAEDSLEQLLDIEKAQDAVRKGKLEKSIDAIEKSVQRLINDLTLIKTIEDALDEFDDSDVNPEGGKKDEKKEPKKR